MPDIVPFVDKLKEPFPLKSPSQDVQQDSVTRTSNSSLSRLYPEPEQQDSVKNIISEGPVLDPALVEWSSDVNSAKQLPHAPFEFRVLEIALDVVCNDLEGRVRNLELKAYPPLDDFARQITLGNMLLEAYFMQPDGTLNRVRMIRRYIDDREDYMKIQLDSQRNQLLEFQMTQIIWHFAMGVGAGVLALVSMNIKIPFASKRHAFIPFVMGVLTLISGRFLVGTMYLYWKGLFETV